MVPGAPYRLEMAVRIGASALLIFLAWHDWKTKQAYPGPWWIGLLAAGLTLAAHLAAGRIALVTFGIVVLLLSEGKLPGWAIAPGMLIGFYSSINEGMPAAVIGWLVAYLAFALNVMGGGDALIMFLLSGFFPDNRLLLLIALFTIAGTLGFGLKSRGVRFLKETITATAIALTRGISQEDLEEKGIPAVFTLSAAGITYLWFFWRGEPWF